MSNRRLRAARQEVNDELARLNTEHHGLRASVVVAAARPAESPLHNAFEWDDSKAGREYRLEQARKLIRVSVTVITHADGTKTKDPYIHVPSITAGEGVYLPMSVVVQDIDAYGRALTALLSKLSAAKAAAEELRSAASGDDGSDRMVRIAMAITALETAGAAVAALH